MPQVKKAREEILKEQYGNFVEHSRSIISTLRTTELLADEVYVGPAAVRIEDVIPASAVILVCNVSAFEPYNLSLGWGAALAPLYFVVNILGVPGIISDRRYGVFKVSVYELLKRDVLTESEGYLNSTLKLDDNRVCMGTGRQTFWLD